MNDPTSRSLRLLALLQSRQHWPGSELRERLDVSARTLRRDVERLRELGYEVTARRGVDGGYRLERGGRLPPLLLEDAEAVAIAVALRAVAGMLGEQAALGALVKLEQMLAPHLRRRVAALQEHVAPAAGAGSRVDVDLIAELALACRDRERVRFAYVAADGAHTSRHVEPHTLVSVGTTWYLVCWDLWREDWRTFRLDRMQDLLRTGARSDPRELPVDEPQDLVIATDTDTPYAVEATVHLDLTPERAREIFGIWATGSMPNPDGGTDWPIGANSLADLVYGPAWIPADVAWTLSAPSDVQEELRVFASALLAAVGGEPEGDTAGAGR